MNDGRDYIADLAARKRAHRRRAFFYIAALILYGVLLAGAWLVLRSQFFAVRDIEIRGNVHVNGSDILALVEGPGFSRSRLARLLGIRNMLAWPSSVSSDTLKFIPQLESLTLEKNYGTRSILIRVTERTPTGIWCFEQTQTSVVGTQANATSSPAQISAPNECFWFDENGTIYKRSFDAEGGLITVVHDYSQNGLGFFSPVLPRPEFIANLLGIFRVLAASGLSAKEIRLNDVSLQEIEVDTYEGPALYFSVRFPADNDLPVIKSLETGGGFSKLHYIDFRVENRAYYK